MLKVLQIIFSILVITFAGYGLITDDYQFQPYMIFFMGLMMLVMGIGEFKRGQKGSGWFSIFVFIFIFLYLLKVLSLKKFMSIKKTILTVEHGLLTL